MDDEIWRNEQWGTCIMSCFQTLFGMEILFFIATTVLAMRTIVLVVFD